MRNDTRNSNSERFLIVFGGFPSIFLKFCHFALDDTRPQNAKRQNRLLTQSGSQTVLKSMPIKCLSMWRIERLIYSKKHGIIMSEWENLVAEVNEYLEATNDLSEAVMTVVKMNLQIGSNNEDERASATLSIKALLKGRDGTPFRKGNKTSIPASVRINIDKICSVYSEAISAFFNHDALMPRILFRHGKSGGGTYESEKEYKLTELKRLRTKLSKMYKMGDWDGHMESLLPHEEE